MVAILVFSRLIEYLTPDFRMITLEFQLTQCCNFGVFREDRGLGFESRNCAYRYIAALMPERGLSQLSNDIQYK